MVRPMTTVRMDPTITEALDAAAKAAGLTRSDALRVLVDDLLASGQPGEALAGVVERIRQRQQTARVEHDLFA